ncbi:hypothetical protein, partial [Luedemannella helvata]
VNETRARNNLSAIEGGDSLITPMNVTEGGLASPRDTAPDPAALPKARGLALVKGGRPAELGTAVTEAEALATSLERWTKRAADRLLVAAGAKAGDMPDLLALWAAGSEDRLAQLEALLADHGYRLAQVGAWEVLNVWNPDAENWSADVMLAWILAAAATHAEQHEEAGRKAVAAAQERGGDGWRESLQGAALAWESAATVRAATSSTEFRSFGGHDAASASGLVKKIWRT